MKAETQQFQQRFLSWYDDWACDLWQLCVYASRSPESVQDEFPELLEMTMKRMRTKFRASSDAGWARHFLAQWLRLQRIRNPRTGLSATEVPFVDRCLLAALFKMGWSVERTALVFGLSASAVRFRVLDTLKRIRTDSTKSLVPLSRDCSRFDLHVLDVFLRVEWHDPLGFFGRESMASHQASCVRCGHLEKVMSEGLDQLTSLVLPPLPSQLREALLQDHSFASRSLIVSWFSTWPWFLRVPLQLTFVAFVVFAVVTVPYVGDLFPELKEKFPQYAHWISQSILSSSETETRLRVRAESVAAVGHPVPLAAQESELRSPWRIVLPASQIKLIEARSEDQAVQAPWSLGAPAKQESDLVLIAKDWARSQPPMASTPESIAETPSETRVAVSPPQAVRIATPMPALNTVSLTPKKLVPKATDVTPPGELQPVSGVAATAAPVQPEPPVVEPKTGTSDLSKAFFRWGAFSQKIELDSPRILEILKKHSVSNAGGLELGARHLGGFYYHFYVSNDALAVLVAELSALGLTDFSRSKATGIREDHPPGKTRVVFLVKPEHPLGFQ